MKKRYVIILCVIALLLTGCGTNYFDYKCEVEEKFDGTYYSYVHIFPEDSTGIIETTE